MQTIRIVSGQVLDQRRVRRNINIGIRHMQRHGFHEHIWMLLRAQRRIKNAPARMSARAERTAGRK